MALFTVGLAGRTKRQTIIPIKVSKALVKCPRREEYDFRAMFRVPETSDPPSPNGGRVIWEPQKKAI